MRAVGVVGSWARDQPRMDSDLDIVGLTDEQSEYSETNGWIADALGEPAVLTRSRQWRVVTERRVGVSSGFEVEFNFAPLTWAATDPCDAGTAGVVRNGLRVVFDPGHVLQDLADAVGR